MKIDIEGIENLVKSISKSEGKDSISGVGKDMPSIVDVPRWSTGLEDLDDMLGGGMPCGRMIEIYGAESSGKTSLVQHLCARQPVCLYIPIEGTFIASRARVFGNRPRQLIVYKRAKYGEQVMNRIIQFSEKGIPLAVSDSVPYMQRKQDVDKIMKSAHNNDINVLGVGGIACLMNDYLPALKEVIEISGTTVIFVNQIRDTVGSFGFGEQTHTPGGHQFRHTMSIRIHVARKDWIKIPNYNPKSSAKDEKVGLIMKCKTVKNKTYAPQHECELPMFFEKGFVRFMDIDGIRKELMKERREYYKKLYK